MRLATRGSAQRAQRPELPPSPPVAGGSAAGWLAAARAARAARTLGGLPNDRHSRRVALLKRVLPAIGVALLLLVAMWPRLAPLWERIRLSFPAIDLRDARDLQMINPRYAGIDRVGRPFLVTAASGRQVPDRQDLMSLQAPRADVKTQGGAVIVVSAMRGVYQSQVALLDLFGDVTLVHQNGTRFLSQTARVNAAGNTAEGSDPVAGHGPSGEIAAQGFRILDRGDTILFTGKSDMRLKGAKPGAAKSAPAALPAPIALVAARVEAEARPLLAADRRAAKPKAADPKAAGASAPIKPVRKNP